MQNSASQSPVLILGAGLSGLMAATVLTDADIQVRLVDKGRSVGGRLATRRIGPGRGDHGAQFFSVRTPEFQQWVDRWLADGLVFVWSHGWGDGSHSGEKADGYPRYAVHGGMNQLAKHLASNLEARGVSIHTAEQVTAISQQDIAWQLSTKHDNSYDARHLIATAPVPQTLALLETGDVSLPATTSAALNRISYAPCLCLLVWIESPVDLPAPGAQQTPDAAVTWIADNQRKGISPMAKVITVHASPDFSRAHYDAPDAIVQEKLWHEIAHLFGSAPVIHEMQIKRWRYALPTQLHDERFIAITDPAPLIFCGDAFGGPRVEGAALSGMAAAAYLAAHGS